MKARLGPRGSSKGHVCANSLRGKLGLVHGKRRMAAPGRRRPYDIINTFPAMKVVLSYDMLRYAYIPPNAYY